MALASNSARPEELYLAKSALQYSELYLAKRNIAQAVYVQVLILFNACFYNIGMVSSKLQPSSTQLNYKVKLVQLFHFMKTLTIQVNVLRIQLLMVFCGFGFGCQNFLFSFCQSAKCSMTKSIIIIH